mmetsp:Transcript_10574/g.30288  ORF Transcript_10574/g.30288 Transcript_10574/m.30288 type:complete len:200 (-) Transcript_10574:87-686(-)
MRMEGDVPCPSPKSADEATGAGVRRGNAGVNETLRTRSRGRSVTTPAVDAPRGKRRMRRTAEAAPSARLRSYLEAPRGRHCPWRPLSPRLPSLALGSLTLLRLLPGLNSHSGGEAGLIQMPPPCSSCTRLQNDAWQGPVPARASPHHRHQTCRSPGARAASPVRRSSTLSRRKLPPQRARPISFPPPLRQQLVPQRCRH